MRKLSAVLASLAALLVGALVVAPPAHAAPAIQITKVQYDSPGADKPVTNKKLNAEWVRITNKGKKTVNLAKWTLHDAGKKHTYRFPTTKLGPGKSIVVHTGKGKNVAGHRYWNRGYYVWNNTGDTAAIRNTKGKVVDTCKWKKGTGVTTC